MQYTNDSTPFNVSIQMRRSLLPNNGLIDLETHVIDDFVFVMAASSNHFNESVDAVASIQTLMPEKPIIYFDLGLEKNHVKEVL